jgi:hypothetical protein
MDKEGPNDRYHERPEVLSHWKNLTELAFVNEAIRNWRYEGSGTEEEPYVVTWIHNDPRNPREWSPTYRWAIVLLMALAVLAVSFCSSAYSAGNHRDL